MASSSSSFLPAKQGGESGHGGNSQTTAAATNRTTSNPSVGVEDNNGNAASRQIMIDNSNSMNKRRKRRVVDRQTERLNKLNRNVRKISRIVPWRDKAEHDDVGVALLSVLDGGGGGVLEDNGNILGRNDHTVGDTNVDGSGDDDEAIRDGQSNNEIDRRMTIDEALMCVSMWKMRRNALEGLPHAIESTASLVQVYYQDMLQQQQQGEGGILGIFSFSFSSSSLALRLAYSSAITRCVNGFADTLQQKRSVATSVSELCRRLGIPTWVVDVRHESSHNNLPTVPVLRMATTTLLNFLQAEYWTPMKSESSDMTIFRQWDQHQSTTSTTKNVTTSDIDENDGDGCGDTEGGTGKVSDDPIQLLIEYKKCATSWATSHAIDQQDINNKINSTNNDEDNNLTKPNKSKNRNGGYNKKRAKPTTKILPYDPLFGEVRRYYDSNDEEEDGENDDDCDGDGDDEDEDDDFDDLTGGAFWSSSINTNANRFALLEPPKKKSKKSKLAVIKAKKKLKQQQKKKKSKMNVFRFRRNGGTAGDDDEKSPHEYAVHFTSSTTPLEGYSIALRFLVWGGVGGAPVGRGVLIPGSEKVFPSNEEGSLKCLFRYAPLIHGICRSWPGFATALLVHLTDFLLSIEHGAIQELLDEEGASDVDPGSIRKLFFLSLWVRFLMSQRFVESLESKLPSQEGTRIKSNWLDIATLEQLQDFGYPLSSLKERFVYHCNDVVGGKEDNQDFESSTSTSRLSLDGLVSCDILAFLEELIPSEGEGKIDPATTTENESDVKHPVETTAMSLDRIEEMLSEGKQDSGRSSQEGFVDANKEAPPRQSWVRCATWDACAIGTMPGYPA